MNLREAWSASYSAALGWSPDLERAIDRVAAGGFCSTLGLALFYAKYKDDPRAYREALRVLERVLARRYGLPRPERTAIVRQALREYLWTACRTCNGVGEINAKRLRVVCEACGGSGIHRYTDRRRAHETGLELGCIRSLGSVFEWTTDYVAKHDRQTNAMLVLQLRSES